MKKEIKEEGRKKDLINNFPANLKLDPPNRIIYSSSSGIKHLGNGYYESTDNDPWFLLKLPYGQAALSLSMQIKSKKSDCLCVIYFSLDKNKNFSENNKLIIGNVDGQLVEKNIVFPGPVYWLRLDPVDQAEDFTIDKCDISITSSGVPVSEHKMISAVDQSITGDIASILRQKATEQSWTGDDTVIFVTHEMSGTGAPLLCRKMSAKAKQLGWHTVMVSLKNCYSSQTVAQFRQDCDLLLVCCESQDIRLLASELLYLGVTYAVLNTVVSGKALRYFHEAGFICICLIHEMYSALRVLQAQGWIKHFSMYADKVVFPARCVSDDFLRYGGDVADKALIMPQGFYKNINVETDSSFKDTLLEKLGISLDSKLIIGAGSINFRKGTDLLPFIARKLDGFNDIITHFLWLGESSDEQYEIELKNQIERMGLSGRFHFLGYVTDETEYMKILSTCDAFTLVSREDPYPSVMMEAMSCRLPVVSFKNSGGADELLSEGRGYLIDYMDIDSFAKVLFNILSEPDFAGAVKDHAKEYIGSQGSFQQYVTNILCLCRQEKQRRVNEQNVRDRF